MDARSSALRIAVVFFFAMIFPCVCFPKTVHTYGGSFNLPIPSPDDPESEYDKGWMADAVIEVPQHLDIRDLDVGIDLTHEALFDLQIILQSPAGTNVILNPAGNSAFIVRGEDDHLYAWGGSVEWSFDDQAEVSIEEATEPFIGAFKPVESLNLFDEQDAFGCWRLRIYDAFTPDTGTFNHFELIITAPEPASAILLTIGVCLTCLRRRREN